MQFIDFEGSNVAYYTDGNWQETPRNPLVLLHGLCEDSTIWDHFIPDLDANAVLRIDFSGFGNSDLLSAHSIEKMAESVKAVLDHLHISRCILVGHSLGGYVAAAIAEFYPTLLSGLGMFHSHPFADAPDKKESRRKAIEFINKNGHVLYVKQLIPSLFADLFVTSNEFLMNSLIYKAVNYSPEAITGAHEAMLNRPDRSDAIRALACPVLVIVGKQDRVVPYELSMQQFTLANTTDVLVLNKVAHMGMFTAKERTVKAVRNFMQLCEN
jgi:pimeloyl-ACP methyl ester carboxylesterase